MSEFDVQGQWEAIQTNGAVATFDMKPRRLDGSFVGLGSHTNGKVRGAGFGSVRNDEFMFRILWNDGTEGAYFGVFTSGKDTMVGATFDVAHPDAACARWHSSRSFNRI